MKILVEVEIKDKKSMNNQEFCRTVEQVENALNLHFRNEFVVKEHECLPAVVDTEACEGAVCGYTLGENLLSCPKFKDGWCAVCDQFPAN